MQIIASLIQNLSGNIGDIKLDQISLGKNIPEDLNAKLKKSFKKQGYGEEGLVIAANDNSISSKVGLFSTEDNLYWYLPKYPGGGARKGKVSISEIEEIGFRKYKLPLLPVGINDRYLKLIGSPKIIFCNGEKVGSIKGLSPNDLRILKLIFDKLSTKESSVTKEEIEASVSAEFSEDTWSPCPRCGSSKVKESKSTYVLVLLALIYFITIKSGIILGFWKSVILGGVFFIIWHLLFGTTYKCKDCGNKWSK